MRTEATFHHATVLLVMVLGLFSMAPSCFTPRVIASPPTYLGTYNAAKDATGKCFAPNNTPYATKGWEPDDPDGSTARHPLFLYFPGTQPVTGSGYDAPVPDAVTKAMAARGFVALAVGYDNGLFALTASDKTALLDCLFNPTQTSGLLGQACALHNVDCENLGVATWGHSLGGAVAITAANAAITPTGKHLVRATWATGVGTVDSFILPKERLRLVNGANDASNGQVSTVTGITGATAPDSCPGQPANQCLRPLPDSDGGTAKGGGWVIVPAGRTDVGSGHCWFTTEGITNNPDFCIGDQTPASGFVDANATDDNEPWALAPGAEFIATTTATPW
jgi:hypothetical protein